MAFPEPLCPILLFIPCIMGFRKCGSRVTLCDLGKVTLLPWPWFHYLKPTLTPISAPSSLSCHLMLKVWQLQDQHRAHFAPLSQLPLRFDAEETLLWLNTVPLLLCILHPARSWPGAECLPRATQRPWVHTPASASGLTVSFRLEVSCHLDSPK